MNKCLITLLGAFALAATVVSVQAGSVPTNSSAARLGELPSVKQRLAAGGPALKPALDALSESADRALKVKPPSVTHRTKPAPSGSMHDYFSQAPYCWPDPAGSNGLPYIAHDGKVNPESRTEASDQRRVETLGGTVRTLALHPVPNGLQKEKPVDRQAPVLKINPTR